MAITVVSPHLDDGVLSCGALLAANPGAVVITALAGGPRHWKKPTPWDAACGFRNGDNVVAVRRAEDREALLLLHAMPLWLDFWDAQYGGSPSQAALYDALRDAIDRLSPRAVFVPLGLYHGDHRLVSDSAIPLVRLGRDMDVFLYEDAIYRTLPHLTEAALARLSKLGIRHEKPVGLAPDARFAEMKERAVRCYGSQIRGLTTEGRLGYEDAFAPERYWRITA
jgi:LmbE family N-acetylglucosaminyl deacetylase